MRKDSSDSDEAAPMRDIDATPVESPELASAIPQAAPPSQAAQAPPVDNKALDDRLLSEV